MDRGRVDGIDLEWEIRGSGEAVLFIHASLLVDGFQPLMAEPALAGHQLVHYHRRGWGDSTHRDGRVTVTEQAGDAAALLTHLGLQRAHVAGHSYGGLIALQLAVDAPGMVGSLALLEPNLLAVPSSAAFNDEVRPAFAAYRSGDTEKAVAHFIGVVTGLSWAECQEFIERHVPGGVVRAVADADTFFAAEVPALAQWEFGAEHAARVDCPVLSVLGSASHRFFREGRELLHQWFPQLEELDVSGAGHLLQLQNGEAVAGGLASFFARSR